ncbi:hypothetical protein BG842_22875 [Haladaptatus sp. W1]|nr:hypothetical protein BG842_22875 [Haladaptatus sp. W1]
MSTSNPFAARTRQRSSANPARRFACVVAHGDRLARTVLDFAEVVGDRLAYDLHSWRRELVERRPPAVGSERNQRIHTSFVTAGVEKTTVWRGPREM